MVDEEPERMQRAAAPAIESFSNFAPDSERNEPFLTLGKKYATELQIGCSNTIDLFFVLFSKTAELEEEIADFVAHDGLSCRS